MIPPELIDKMRRFSDDQDLTKGLRTSFGKLLIQSEAYNLSESSEPKNPRELGNRRREIRRSVYKIFFGQHFRIDSLDQLLGLLEPSNPRRY